MTVIKNLGRHKYQPWQGLEFIDLLALRGAAVLWQLWVSSTLGQGSKNRCRSGF
jgi:hypothetical protein